MAKTSKKQLYRAGTTQEDLAAAGDKIIREINQVIENRTPCLVKLRGMSEQPILMFLSISEVSKPAGTSTVIRHLVMAKNLRTGKNFRRFYASRVLKIKQLTQKDLFELSGGTRL